MCPRTVFPLQLIIILYHGKLEPLTLNTKIKSRSVFNFLKANYEGMASHLLEIDFFSPCLISSDIDFIWNFIKASIAEATEIYIPKIRIRPHQFPVWFNSSIRHQINCVHSLQRKASARASITN